MHAMSIPGAIAALALAGSAALAGDYAELEALGFSPDGRTFAFEEYGVQDGSGFPYSNIYVIDTASDNWVSGTPIRVLTKTETARLQETRAEARNKARSILQGRQVGEPGNHVASNPPTEMSADPHRVVFLPRMISPPGGTAHDLSLTEISLPAGDCPDLGSDAYHGFSLTLTSAATATRTLASDSAIPSSRHCPLGYGISDVFTYYPPSGEPVLAVIVNMYTVGFEGPDRRFLAVTSTLPQ
jgi:predicted secreted protein